MLASNLQRLDFNIELAPAEKGASGHVKASGTVPLAGVSPSQQEILSWHRQHVHAVSQLHSRLDEVVNIC